MLSIFTAGSDIIASGTDVGDGRLLPNELEFDL
jgi:hypothetical protein